MSLFIMQRAVDGKWFDAAKFEDREKAVWTLRREKETQEFVNRGRGDTMARPQPMRVIEVIE